jgi:hypothetical protein
VFFTNPLYRSAAFLLPFFCNSPAIAQLNINCKAE